MSKGKSHKKHDKHKKESFLKSFPTLISNLPQKNKILFELFVILPILLFVFYTFSSYKVHMMQMNPGYSPQKDNGMFWSETAFQYRYAKLFAENNPDKWNILNNDIALQYPEGVNTWKDYTTFMEIVHGYFYYYFIPKSIPFHNFLIWFVSLFSASMIFIIYWFVRSEWNNKSAALFSSIIWVLIPAGFYRQVSNIYLKEDFSFIFIFLFILLFIIGIRKNKMIYPIVGSVCLFISLVSWHFSQFMFLLLVGIIFIFYIFEKEWKEHYTKSIIIYLVAGIFAGIVPVLWERTFLFSQPMLLIYAILISITFLNKIFIKNNWLIRFAFPFGMFVIFSLTNILFNSHLKEYAHVFELLIYKIKYLGVMPTDPNLMPYEVRIFWAGNFDGLNISEIISQFYYISILIPIVFLYYLFTLLKKKLSSTEIIIFLLFISSFLISILVGRLIIFFVGFLAISSGILFIDKIDFDLTKNKFKSSKNINRKQFYYFIIILIISIPCIINFMLYKSLSPVIEEKLESRTELFDWINNNTKSTESFLTQISEGPMILLYTGRPVILNSQFENTHIRNKAQDFNSAFYCTEDSLFEFCRKYRSDYVIINHNMVLRTNPGSIRFSACFSERLPINSSAAFMQFYPEKLKHFIPVFDNATYRIFKVIYDTVSGIHIHWKKGYSSYFNPIIFRKDSTSFYETNETLNYLTKADNIVKEAQEYFLAISQLLQKNNGNPNIPKLQTYLQTARNNMHEAIKINPYEFTFYHNLGILEAQVGNINEALNYLTKGLELAPGDQPLQTVIFDILGRSQKWDEIIKVGILIENDSSSTTLSLSAISFAYFSKKEYIKAVEYSTKAIYNYLNDKDPSVFDFYNPYYIRGVSNFFLNKLSEAKSDLIESKKIKSNPQFIQNADKILSAISNR